MSARRWIHVAVCALIAITVSALRTAHAGYDISYMSAGRLLKICQSQVSINVTSCSGYIIGAFDAVRQLATDTECSFKLDPNMNRPQIIDDVKRYLEGHPEEADLTAVMIIKTALHQFYPCP